MRKIAIVFPGQGAQYVGMGQNIANEFEASMNIFDRATKSLDLDMKELCFNSSEEELRKTENTQPSILTTSYAIYQALVEAGVKADAFAGLSLGEYTALVAAGVIKFEDAVKIVKQRGKFMQEEVPIGVGGMAAVLGSSREQIEELCKYASEFGICEPANFNCPKQIVIAGEIKAIEKAVEVSKEYGAKKAILLPVSAPFHTSLLIGAGEKLGEEMKKYEFSDLAVPVITNVTGKSLDGSVDIKDNLVKQVSNSVRWEDCVTEMIDMGINFFIEVGPGNALTKFIKKISKEVTIVNVESKEDIEALLEQLK